MRKKERATAVTDLLEIAYPDAECALIYSSAYELLFATRLSAQCTDIRVNIVTQQLFKTFPTLESFANGDIKDIENDIRTCGLYRTKAKDIKAAAEMLVNDFGGVVPDNMDDLLKLPGIGRKTANLILGDIYGQPSIVADTHCIRLSNRLGFVKDEKDAHKVEIALRKIIAPEKSTAFCHRLVLHGRAVCSARSPKCLECTLKEICPSADKKTK